MASGSDSALELLERGRGLIQDLAFQALDRDSSLEAFETFRRALLRVMRGTCHEAHRVVDELEPKSKLVEFLLDFAGRYIAYRSRVAEVLKSLLKSSVWSAALAADMELSMAIDGVVSEAQVAPTTPGGGKHVAKDLEKAAAVAAACGDIGVLSVRVHAAHHLLVGQASDCSKLCIAVILGQRTSRTGSVPGSVHPRWSGEELVFDVATSDWLLKLELLDGDATCGACFGRLSISLAGAIKNAGPVTMRCPFDDLPHGELELTLQYAPGTQAATEQVQETFAPVDAREEPVEAPKLWANVAHTSAKQTAAPMMGADPWSSTTADPWTSVPSNPWASLPAAGAGTAASSRLPCNPPAASMQPSAGQSSSVSQRRPAHGDNLWGQKPSAGPAPPAAAAGVQAASARQPGGAPRVPQAKVQASIPVRESQKDLWAAASPKTRTPTSRAGKNSTNPFKTSATPTHRMTKVSRPDKGGATPTSRKLKLSTNPFKMVENVASRFGA